MSADSKTELMIMMLVVIMIMMMVEVMIMMIVTS